MKTVLCALALLAASATAVAAPCDAAVARIAVPAGWSAHESGGIAHFGAPGEFLTVASYAYLARAPSPHEREALLRKDAELALAAERQAGAVRLSPVRWRHEGSRLEACYSGSDGDRQFVSLSVASTAGVKHFYFEALGVGEGAFAQRAARIFVPGAEARQGPAMTALAPLAPTLSRVRRSLK